MGIHFDLELILVVLTFISGLIIFFYWLKNKNNKEKTERGEEPIIVDYAKSFFPILLIVVILRSFVAEPFRIPSGSMIPTLEIGDFILVKKYSYGIRLPVLHNKVIETGLPERGDVVVFRYPPDPKVNYIKRLIGLPGDSIKWTKDKRLFINGNEIESRLIGDYQVKSKNGFVVKQYSESLPGDKHHQLIKFPGFTQAGEWQVPNGQYFLMGDNRDKSSDSRFWGFVPESNLVGKASMVWMHWNWQKDGDGFQFSRIGTAVQ